MVQVNSSHITKNLPIEGVRDWCLLLLRVAYTTLSIWDIVNLGESHLLFLYIFLLAVESQFL